MLLIANSRFWYNKAAGIEISYVKMKPKKGIKSLYLLKGTTMNIQTRKAQLLKRLEGIEDINLIKAIDSILDYAAAESESRIGIEQYNRELEAANSRIEAGKYLSHGEVEKESKSW